MRQVMVRYKVKPDRVAENEALVRAVYEELRAPQPAGLRYATFRPRGRRQLRPPGDGRGRRATRWPRSRRSSASRRTSATAATSRRSSSRRRRSARTGHDGRARSSTSSCTPATCRARARSTRSCSAGARGTIELRYLALDLARRLRRRHRRVRDRAPGLAPLRRGRRRRRGHRPGAAARRLGAARAARRPGRLAQRRRGARRW